MSKFISISELASKIGLIDKKNGKPSTHTLRFWGKKFKQIKPTILNGNRRYYSKKDEEIINLIHYLLKTEGLTIDGAKKILNKKINSLDEYNSSSIKTNYYLNKLKNTSKILLKKIKKINGKKNTY